MSSSSTDLAHASSSQIFAFDNIINKNLITELLKNISEAQESIKTKSEEDRNINTSTNTNTNTTNTISNTTATSTSTNTTSTNTNTNINTNTTTTNTKAATTGNNGSSINCLCCKNTTATTDRKAVTNVNINTGGNTRNNGGTPKSGTSKNPNENQNNKSKNLSLHLNGKLENLRIDLDYVQKSFNNLREYEDHVVNPFEAVSNSVNSIVTEIKADPSDSLLQNRDFQARLRELEKDVMNLKVHIPSAHKMYSSAISEVQHFTAPSVPGYNAPKTMGGLPVLSMSENFQSSSAYNDFQEIYNTLDFNLKLCLLCFSVFPEKAVVKRRILMYWWIGEGLIVPKPPEKTVEEVADDILVQFVKKGLIQAVNKQHRSVADCFSMHPLIRSAVIMRAKKVEFFDFDDQGNPTANFVSSRRACLFGKGSSFQLSSEKKEGGDDAESSKGKKREEEERNKAELSTREKREEKRNKAESKRKKQEEIKKAQLKHEKLYTLYNVNEEYLKFEPEWFLKLKNVRVLQVGRWMSSAENHIEVEDIEFLKRLKNMKLLMYFSLQGISRISELPDTIGSLTNLRILDLRACHNLEILPEEIGALQNLTHLDMSECYLLDNMPHGIASLIQLEVLKGFVIGDRKTKTRCTLTDLKRLTKLRKLTISTSLKAFPTLGDLKALYKFEALRKLKIAWGGSSEVAKPSSKKLQISKSMLRFPTLRTDATTVPEIAALPTALEKLDLQCFPHTNTPSWLNPSHLTKLKKLYIRGGNLSDLSDNEMDHKWEVTILRLKYLYELVIDWTELRASFPKLMYLEMVKCPKLTFCPCDDTGVWRNR